MGWLKQLCLLRIILSACVFGQELRSTLRQGNHTCPGDEVIFTCTIRGSSGLLVLVLGWNSPEYIVQGGSLQLSTANMIGDARISTGMDGNITAIATLTNITIDNGDRVLESTLHITATVASTVTCSNSGTGGTGSIEFSISAIPDAPRNVRAAQVSQDNGNDCIILVTWDPPDNIDVSDIDYYIITVSSRNIMETESFAITALRIRNCHRNDSIQVAAVNRFGCIGETSLQTRPSLLDIIARTTESITSTPIGSTTGASIGSTTSTPTGSTSASGSVIAAIVATVLFIITLVLSIIALVLFGVLYNKGKKGQAALQLGQLQAMPPNNSEEPIETETKLIDAQGTVQDTLVVKRNLEELYKALKLKLPSTNMQVVARDLKKTLVKDRKSAKFNESVKEALISCLETIQPEDGKEVEKAFRNMDNIVTGMTGINEELKACIRSVRTQAGNGEHTEILDELIKKVENVKPGDVMEILLSLCEKLRNIRQVKDYYCKQSKHDIDKLGTEKDRVSVPIWMDGALDRTWKDGLREAVQAINEAAPGLSLSIAKNKKQAIIHVLRVAVDKEELYTEVEGNILMRLKEKTFITTIHLGKWKDEGKKGVCIHELLHAVGFHHEHQYAIADPYIYRLDSGKEITIDKNELGFIHLDTLTTTLYPCEENCREHSEDHVCKWVLKEYPAQVNTELDELDRIGLNLVYPPCIDKTANSTGYRPKLGKNGMYYCGRIDVVLSQTDPQRGYTCPCGPIDGPNCSACRSIKSPRVEEILAGRRWQGLSGRVYCGRLFAEPAELFPSHDGMCGMNNGPACPECKNILNKLKAPEHVQSASDPLASVQ